MVRASVIAVLACLLAGCAKVPDVTLSYYLATWKTTVLVTQTVGCSEQGEHLTWRANCTATTTYLGDTSKRRELPIKGPDHSYADSSIAMTLTEDGRLKGINQSSTGQGEVLLKASVALAPLLLSSSAFSPGTREPGADETRRLQAEVIRKAACDVINASGRGTPITLSYRKEIGAADLGKTIRLEPIPESKDLYDKIRNALPELCLLVGDLENLQSGADWPPGRSLKKSPSGADGPLPHAAGDCVPLTLQKVGLIRLEVQADSEALGNAIVLVVPDTGDRGTYQLPIPKAAFFGSHKFSITLSDAGAITNISYEKTSGAAGAANSVGAIGPALSPTALAADLRAQADIIAQQQRLVLCETRPDQCK
jgi:hypothetical protein